MGSLKVALLLGAALISSGFQEPGVSSIQAASFDGSCKATMSQSEESYRGSGPT